MTVPMRMAQVLLTKILKMSPAGKQYNAESVDASFFPVVGGSMRDKKRYKDLRLSKERKMVIGEIIRD